MADGLPQPRAQQHVGMARHTRTYDASISPHTRPAHHASDAAARRDQQDQTSISITATAEGRGAQRAAAEATEGSATHGATSEPGHGAAIRSHGPHGRRTAVGERLPGMRLVSRRILARLTPALGYTRCLRCRSPWRMVDPHIVWHGRGVGAFALCQSCWTETTSAERADAARELVNCVSPGRSESERHAIIRAHHGGDPKSLRLLTPPVTRAHLRAREAQRRRSWRGVRHP